MKMFLAAIFGFCLILSQSLQAQEVASFKEWKKNKVIEAQGDISQLETLQKGSPTRFGPEEQAKLKQAKTNLEIAQDLNAQDYFILYLSPKFQNDTIAYTKAVQMMTPEEVAQILVGYDKLIEERRKKSLIPLDNMKFGFSVPKKLEPEVIISAISK